MQIPDYFFFLADAAQTHPSRGASVLIRAFGTLVLVPMLVPVMREWISKSKLRRGCAMILGLSICAFAINVVYYNVSGAGKKDRHASEAAASRQRLETKTFSAGQTGQNPQAAALGAEAQRRYQALQQVRRDIDTSDPKAIARYNKEAASYAQLVEKLKAASSPNSGAPKAGAN